MKEPVAGRQLTLVSGRIFQPCRTNSVGPAINCRAVAVGPRSVKMNRPYNTVGRRSIDRDLRLSIWGCPTAAHDKSSDPYILSVSGPPGIPENISSPSLIGSPYCSSLRPGLATLYPCSKLRRPASKKADRLYAAARPVTGRPLIEIFC